MLRGDDHVGGTEQGVAAGGVNGQGITCGGAEVDLCAVAAADPVLLLGGDALDVIQSVQTVDELVGICVIFSIHWLLTRWTTSLPQRSHTPLTTSSLARTHLQPVHQLTFISFL